MTIRFIVTTITSVIYEWDEKRIANLAKHGVDFTLADDFAWDSLIVPDQRFEYGEARFFAIGWIGERLHVLVFTPRGESVRVIGLRKANTREMMLYETKI